MSPTTTRAALRRAGILLVAAALVGVPVSGALAEPTPEPTSTATAGTPAPSASSEPTVNPSPGEGPTGTPSPSTSAVPTPSDLPSTSAPAPSTSAPAPSAGTGDGGRSAIAALVASPEGDAAAAFMARTLADNDDHYVYPASTFFDGGNTIDAIIAMSAIGTEDAQADASLAYLDANLGGYTGADFDELYAGPTAKALLGVLVAGGDPTDFGGTDLVADLQDLETAGGRFSDDSAFGDYSNTIGQSLALVALSRAGEPLTAASVELLLDQQCSDGGFRGSIGAATCTSDADATAFAAQALVAAAGTLVCGTGADGLPARATAAADDGLDALEALQGPDGGILGSEGAQNANTTGVAAQAFVAGGRTTAAEDAAGFVATLQYDASTPAALQGGIAYSATTRSTTTPSDTDLRATPQAALGLALESLVTAIAEGAADPAPASACPAVPSVTVTPTSSTDPTTTTAPTSGSDGGETTGPVASGPDALAQTGSDLLLPVGVGLALLVVGGLAVAASRRRGAHA
ncbi:hypothetical protein [Oryzobacter terrae]|uniref:hypothetical protein n=1 Tax=Oryzobacter terrae TaxID=1620385 RepID=UPI00367213C8